MKEIAMSRYRSTARAFTLIELLVVIAIVALLISILMPALNQAKNEGTKAQCGANLREISNGNLMYETDQNGDLRLPWYQAPAHDAPADATCGTLGGVAVGTGMPTHNVMTPWVFGGFKAPLNPEQGDPNKADAWAYPAQIRPLNKFIDRSATSAFDAATRGRDIIKSFIDSSDRSNSVGLIGQEPNDDFAEQRTSWQANGSSYTLNTRWLQGYYGDVWTSALPQPDCPGPGGDDYAKPNARLVPHIVGGGGSRFIKWIELGFYSFAQNARWPGQPYASNSPGLKPGWHRKFSAWQAAFADGHVNYGYFDTRQCFGLDGTIWQPDIKPGDGPNIPGGP
jgi:prepilin-type N-terminal cleavage/methylation domain-containing protein